MRALLTAALTTACAPSVPPDDAAVLQDDSGTGFGQYDPADAHEPPCDASRAASLSLRQVTDPDGAAASSEPLLPGGDLTVWRGPSGGWRLHLHGTVAHVPRLVFVRTSLHTADGVDLVSAPPLDDAPAGQVVQAVPFDPTPEQGCVTEGTLGADAWLDWRTVSPAAPNEDDVFAALCGLPVTLAVEVAWPRCWDGDACDDVTRPRAVRVEVPVVLQPDPRVMAVCAPR